MCVVYELLMNAFFVWMVYTLWKSGVGVCDFCLICDACGFKYVRIGSMLVSSVQSVASCCVLYSL